MCRCDEYLKQARKSISASVQCTSSFQTIVLHLSEIVRNQESNTAQSKKETENVYRPRHRVFTTVIKYN